MFQSMADFRNSKLLSGLYGFVLCAMTLAVISASDVFLRWSGRKLNPDNTVSRALLNFDNAVSGALLIIVLLGAAAAGFLVAVLLYRAEDRQPSVSWCYIPLFCALVMALAALGGVSSLQALLVIVLGSAALVAAANALVRFREGEMVELQSNWGGLGGGFGGWRLSSVTSLSVLALIFAGSATVAGQIVVSEKEIRQLKEQLVTLQASKSSSNAVPLGGTPDKVDPSVKPAK